MFLENWLQRFNALIIQKNLQVFDITSLLKRIFVWDLFLNVSNGSYVIIRYFYDSMFVLFRGYLTYYMQRIISNFQNTFKPSFKKFIPSWKVFTKALCLYFCRLSIYPCLIHVIILRLPWIWYMFLRFTISCLILKIKYVAFTVRLQRYLK